MTILTHHNSYRDSYFHYYFYSQATRQHYSSEITVNVTDKAGAKGRGCANDSQTKI